MLSLKHYKHLKASSLVESVIAIAIISTCVLIAFMIYVNIVKQNDSINYYNAMHKVDFLIQESITNKDYDEDTFTLKGYTINKKVDIQKTEQTVLLTFTIKTGDKIYKTNKLIPYLYE